MKGENIRDMADINTLTILSNLESYNAILIKRGLSKKERAQILSQTYQDQKTILENRGIIKSMKQSSKNIKSNDDFDKGIDKIIGFEEKGFNSPNMYWFIYSSFYFRGGDSEGDELFYMSVQRLDISNLICIFKCKYIRKVHSSC